MPVWTILSTLKVIRIIDCRRAPDPGRSRGFAPRAPSGPSRPTCDGAVAAGWVGACVEASHMRATERRGGSYRARRMQCTCSGRAFRSRDLDSASMAWYSARGSRRVLLGSLSEAQGGGATSSGGQTGPVILRTYPYLTHGTAGPVTGGPPGRRWAAPDPNRVEHDQRG